MTSLRTARAKFFFWFWIARKSGILWETGRFFYHTGQFFFHPGQFFLQTGQILVLTRVARKFCRFWIQNKFIPSFLVWFWFAVEARCQSVRYPLRNSVSLLGTKWGILSVCQLSIHKDLVTKLSDCLLVIEIARCRLEICLVVVKERAITKY